MESRWKRNAGKNARKCRAKTLGPFPRMWRIYLQAHKTQQQEGHAGCNAYGLQRIPGTQYTQRRVLAHQLSKATYTRILAWCYDTLDHLHPRQGVEKISVSYLAGQLGSHALAVVFARVGVHVRSRCVALHLVQLRSPRSARLVLHTSCCTSVRSLRELRCVCAVLRIDPGRLRCATPTRAQRPLRVVCTLCYTNLTRSARVWCVLRTAPTSLLRSRLSPPRVSRVRVTSYAVCPPSRPPLLPPSCAPRV